MGTTPLHSGTPTAAPVSRVRYGVLAFLGALAFILYVDRVCISQAAGAIRAELDITHTAMSFVFGAFTVAYGLFEIPTGRWGDRYGSRGVLVRIVLWWSAFTALTGCVPKFAVGVGGFVLDSFLTLLLVRFLFGAGEAGAFPNVARVLATWFPSTARGPAQGMINTSALLGGAVAPIVAAYLIGLVGWRWSFILFGSLGVVWAAGFYVWFRDDPAEHPAVNEAERRLIGSGSGPVRRSHLPIPWGAVVASANVWLLGGVISCTAFTSYLYITWYPTYLKEARGVDEVTSGWLAGLVLGAGAVGSIAGGFLGDGLVRRTGNRRVCRRLIGFSGLSVASVALVASVFCDSPLEAALATAFASFSAYLTIASWWAVVTEISGSHVGSLFGLLNSMGVPGALASQLFFGRFADLQKQRGLTGREQLDAVFYVYGAVLLLGAFGWLFIDATKPVQSTTDAAPGERGA